MSAPPTPRHPTRLKITDDKGFEKIVLIETDKLTIGSDPSCELVVPCDTTAQVAPRHAIIAREGATHILKDESGPRGTRVNGRPIRRTVLAHGDEISLGSSTLRIRYLVEGSRASDQDRRQVRALLELLAAIHECGSEEEIIRRAEDGARELLGAVWVKVTSQPNSSSRSLLQKDHMSVPLRRPDAAPGAIETGPREGRPYRETDLEILEAVTRHVGIAMANAARRRESAAGLSAVNLAG